MRTFSGKQGSEDKTRDLQHQVHKFAFAASLMTPKQDPIPMPEIREAQRVKVPVQPEEQPPHGAPPPESQPQASIPPPPGSSGDSPNPRHEPGPPKGHPPYVNKSLIGISENVQHPSTLDPHNEVNLQ